ncbi:MAG: agmatinase [Phycisphaerae bacterium]|nr:agmatinase [Phycisphaerae bacterium]
MTAAPDNFLGLPPRYSDPRRSRYAVLPIPYDSTTSFQVGTRNGPRAIISASQQVELFDEQLGGEFHRAGIATLPPVAPEMAGPEAQHSAVFSAARPVVAAGKFLIGLGGEHSVTSALVRAVRTKHRKLSVLQIDAHADLRDAYEGTKYSHASAMRRVLDAGASLVAVGIRNYSAEEHRFMQVHRYRPITARDCRVRLDWIEEAVDLLESPVYVTIDIDGFDPACAPGTGTPEPGGLDWYQVTDLLRAVTLAHRVVGCDVVEVMPLPGSMQTEFLAAKLIYKLIAFIETGARK